MVKAYCMWCESGEGQPRPDMFWVHVGCFEEITDMMSDIKYIKKSLEEREPTTEIVRFIQRMENFNRRWQGTKKIIDKLTHEKSACPK